PAGTTVFRRPRVWQAAKSGVPIDDGKPDAISLTAGYLSAPERPRVRWRDVRGPVGNPSVCTRTPDALSANRESTSLPEPAKTPRKHGNNAKRPRGVLSGVRVNRCGVSCRRWLV